MIRTAEWPTRFRGSVCRQAYLNFSLPGGKTLRYTSVSQSALRSFLFALTGIAAVGQVNITTWQADLRHTGANLNETILTPATIGSPGSFGLLFTQALDGQSYGQPLYVSSAALETFADGSRHTVISVATEPCSGCTFDADTNSTAQKTVTL